jgi:hypothetical protein
VVDGHNLTHKAVREFLVKPLLALSVLPTRGKLAHIFLTLRLNPMKCKSETLSRNGGRAYHA